MAIEMQRESVRLQFSRNWQEPCLLRERLSSYPHLKKRKVTGVRIPAGRIIDAIDSDNEEFDPKDPAKLLLATYFVLYGETAIDEIRKDFGEAVTTEIGVDLSDSAMKAVKGEYFGNGTLTEEVDVVLSRTVPSLTD